MFMRHLGHMFVPWPWVTITWELSRVTSYLSLFLCIYWWILMYALAFILSVTTIKTWNMLQIHVSPVFKLSPGIIHCSVLTGSLFRYRTVPLILACPNIKPHSCYFPAFWFISNYSNLQKYVLCNTSTVKLPRKQGETVRCK